MQLVNSQYRLNCRARSRSSCYVNGKRSSKGRRGYKKTLLCRWMEVVIVDWLSSTFDLKSRSFFPYFFQTRAKGKDETFLQGKKPSDGHPTFFVLLIGGIQLAVQHPEPPFSFHPPGRRTGGQKREKVFNLHSLERKVSFPLFLLLHFLIFAQTTMTIFPISGLYFPLHSGGSAKLPLFALNGVR